MSAATVVTQNLVCDIHLSVRLCVCPFCGLEDFLLLLSCMVSWHSFPIFDEDSFTSL